MKATMFFLFILICTPAISKGYDVFGFGLFDVKFDGREDDRVVDYRYERRFDNSLLEIGPENYEFFDLKPFIGLEATSYSAKYILAGVYLEDNIGILFTGDSSNFILTPSFGAGYYDDGDGKKLGYNIEFRTTLEVSYQLKNENRIGFSLGHISNANIANENPGVEVLSFSYQVAY